MKVGKRFSQFVVEVGVAERQALRFAPLLPASPNADADCPLFGHFRHPPKKCLEEAVGMLWRFLDKNSGEFGGQ